MVETELEIRVKTLETEVAFLKEQLGKNDKNKLPWWKQIIGTFANDPAHEEAMRLGREYRLSQRENYEEDEEK